LARAKTRHKHKRKRNREQLIMIDSHGEFRQMMSKNMMVWLGILLSVCPFAAVLAEDKLTLHPVVGPAHVILGDKLAAVDLPQDYLFLNKDDSAALLKRAGESSAGVLGIIIPKQKEDRTFNVVCRFEDMGYVRDTDADKLDADEILKQTQEDTKAQNDDRRLHGFPPYYIGGWAEKPHYDKASHQVIWAITVKDQDTSAAPVACINYNTRILGRAGVLSMNLVTDPDKLDVNKGKVAAILKATFFTKGQTYADYQPGKDKDSGLGLAGLILGGGAVAAAAKLGIFGGLWKFAIAIVLVLKKFAIVAVVAAAVFLSRLFGKKKAPDTSVTKGASNE
jgi:uncharacterized membrane-anchored protein